MPFEDFCVDRRAASFFFFFLPVVSLIFLLSGFKNVSGRGWVEAGCVGLRDRGKKKDSKAAEEKGAL